LHKDISTCHVIMLSIRRYAKTMYIMKLKIYTKHWVGLLTCYDSSLIKFCGLHENLSKLDTYEFLGYPYVFRKA
jgi:hypothetical protein